MKKQISLQDLFKLTPYDEKIENILFKDKVEQIIEEFLNEQDWRVYENANRAKTYYSLLSQLAQHCIALYSLDRLPEEYAYGHKTGWWHIHDLGVSGIFIRYCSGLDMSKLLLEGFKPVLENTASSKPPKHLSTVLDQLLNFFTVFSHESAGAVSISSLDIYCAPYIYYDRLYYSKILNLDPNSKEMDKFMENYVYQCVQRFVWNLNYPLRAGFEALFTNVTLDLSAQSSGLANDPIIYNGEVIPDKTYKEFQDEVNLFNKCFLDIKLKGMPDGRPHSFPIITLNITEDFEEVLDDELKDLIFKCSTRYGEFYFQNCINGELALEKINPSDVRSMCCRLNLNLKEVYRRVGGFFSGGNNVGSICVTTINLPRIGYVSRKYFSNSNRLSDILDIIDNILDVEVDTIIKGMKKRKELILLHSTKKYNLAPFIKAYENPDMPTYFITVGFVGLNEMLINMGIPKGLSDERNIEVAERIMKILFDKVHKYQDIHDVLVNIEATPAEGAGTRLARLDKKYFG